MNNPHTAYRPPYIEEIRAEARGQAYRPAKKMRVFYPPPDPDEARPLFTVATGNRWMELGSRQAEARMLFGPLWYQNELCMLFADTNAGKSVLAVQIAEAICRRRNIGPFPVRAKPCKVLYVDFELSTSQFRVRYTSPAGDYDFSDNFVRAQFNSAQEVPGHYQSLLHAIIAGIQLRISDINPGVLIIDNITCLRGSTESAAAALPLMQSLHKLKSDNKLSVLVLAHTPKRRNPGSPLTADDMQGSKILLNFADSAFALAKSSTHPGLHYIKQIKQRNTEQIYGPDNVCLCRLQKRGNFLSFRFEGNSPEREHLYSSKPTAADQKRQQLIGQITALAATGLSQRQISRKLNISLGTVNQLSKS